MERKSKLTIAIAAAVLAVLGATVIYAQDHAQDKYSLKTPSGIASPTSGDTRTGRRSLPPGLTKCSR